MSKSRPTWRRRSGERPDEILDAALDAFVAKGFDSSRIEDIAARAGLSKGAIYLYFESKEALLQALVEREIAPLIARFAAMADAETGDPKAALGGILEQFALVAANPRIFAIPRLVISIAARFPKLRDHYRSAVAEPARAVAERLIRRGIANGQFRNIDPAAGARMIIGPMLFEALWTHVLAGESAFADPKTFVRTQMDILTGGIGA